MHGHERKREKWMCGENERVAKHNIEMKRSGRHLTKPKQKCRHFLIESTRSGWNSRQRLSPRSHTRGENHKENDRPEGGAAVRNANMPTWNANMPQAMSETGTVSMEM